MKNGVYQIRHLESGKRYIGSAASDGGFNKRWSEHRLALRKQTHHSIKFQRAWNKYSADSFIFEILLYCDPENCLMYEQIALDYYKTKYNVCLVAGNTRGQKPFLGKRHNQTSRRKMSQAKIGTRHTTESKLKMAQSKNGLYVGEKHPRAKLSLRDVEKIRQLLTKGQMQHEIAELFDVSRVTISHIKCGRTW